MTHSISSISSLMALLSNGSSSSTSSTSSTDQDFLSLLDSIDGSSTDSSGDSSDSTDSSNDIFGTGTSSPLGLSSAAFSMLSGGDSNNSSTIDVMAVQDTLSGNGPLPAYLKQVDAGLGLNASQAQALQSIAINNINTDGSTTSVNQIAQELQAAGIA
jgi:hypothetical protein